MENQHEAMELSTQELDCVAGGATRADYATVHDLKDTQLSTLTATRGGISSSNLQATDDFSATVAEFNQTGYPS